MWGACGRSVEGRGTGDNRGRRRGCKVLCFYLRIIGAMHTCSSSSSGHHRPSSIVTSCLEWPQLAQQLLLLRKQLAGPPSPSVSIVLTVSVSVRSDHSLL